MYTKATLISAILAVAEARFGQEQVPVAAIQALGDFGNPGEAATLSGAVPGVLLGAADPCGKLSLADDIVATLGNDPQVIAAARELVAAEQNFNPFATNVPNICGDASLPATEELRGVVPLVDPAVVGSDVENANSELSLQTPFDANGLSVAEVMIAQGFSNFTVNGAAADAGAGANNGDNAGNGGVNNGNGNGNGNGNNNGNANDNANNGGNGNGNGNNNNNGNANDNANNGNAGTPAQCGAPPAAGGNAGNGNANNGGQAGNNNDDNSNNNNNNNNDDDATGNGAIAEGTGAVSDPVTGTFLGFEASSLGLDFGTCVPTVKFEESLNGRAPGEFTFQAIDPVVNQGQQEALNPAIIFNRICDQLVNVCGAADDAVEACQTAEAELGTGPKDETTANAWNEALGFAGTDINPDNAPQEGLVGHT
ncbi:hypothetical protein DL770_003057 [Monosporascus sp. CRB-9-2]|nr:hypothetical protein DL770_003057 [Monosporascus sp. CRB-9-2]